MPGLSDIIKAASGLTEEQRKDLLAKVELAAASDRDYVASVAPRKNRVGPVDIIPLTLIVPKDFKDKTFLQYVKGMDKLAKAQTGMSFQAYVKERNKAVKAQTGLTFLQYVKSQKKSAKLGSLQKTFKKVSTPMTVMPYSPVPIQPTQTSMTTSLIKKEDEVMDRLLDRKYRIYFSGGLWWDLDSKHTIIAGSINPGPWLGAVLVEGHPMNIQIGAKFTFRLRNSALIKSNPVDKIEAL